MKSFNLLICLNILMFTSGKSDVLCKTNGESSCCSDAEWLFIGRNLEYKKIYSINYFSGAIGISVNCINGYRLFGFDEKGKARKLFWAFYSTTTAKGWFHEIESRAGTKSLVLEMTSDGHVFMKGRIDSLSELATWTLGSVRTSISFSKERDGLFKEKIVLDFGNFYSNDSGGSGGSNKVFFEISKEKVSK